jgi:Family of unknown function (DUF6428)
MTIRELVQVSEANPEMAVGFVLPTGEMVPAHFHITEVGHVRKDFIDCGGTTRSSSACVLQLWVAGDLAHRLNSSKLARILDAGKSLLPSDGLPVEVEYEKNGVCQLHLSAAEITPAGLMLYLGNKRTECLAPDRCGVGQDCCSDSAAGTELHKLEIV